jgi:hypothetical protein
MEIVSEIKPRRTWGQRLRRGLVWFASFIVVVSFALWVNAQYNNYQSFERELVEFRNVRIGTSQPDVSYTLGRPSWVIADIPAKKSGPWDNYPRVYEVASTSGPNIMPKGKTIEDFNEWLWVSGDEDVGVAFDPKTGLVNSFSCSVGDESTSLSNCSGIGSITAGDSEDAVLRALGTPDRVEFSKDSLTKTLVYTDIGLEVNLSQREVYRWVKTSPKDLGVWWWLTHGRPS